MRKINRFLPVFLLAAVVLFSLGTTLKYYFYTDDYAFLYYLRNNLDFGWPYNHVLTLFRPIYLIFGNNPFPYFSLALVTYFFASLALYFFITKLTGNKLIGFLSSILFATGYIGIDQFTMIAVSIIDNLNIVNVCITLIVLLYWVKRRKIKYYLLTLLAFWISVRFFPYRAYPLILFIPTVELIIGFQAGTLKKTIKQLFFLALRFIPFVFIASRYGVFAYSTHGVTGVEDGNYFSFFTNLQSKLSTILNFDLFKEIFAILGRFIFIKPISDLFSIAPDRTLYYYVGLVFFLVIVATSIFFLSEKYLRYSRSLLLVILLTIEGYIGNMFLNTDFDSNGVVNRYLTISFLSFSAIIPIFLFLILEKIGKFKSINKKWALSVLVALIVLPYALSARTYENAIVENRSIPSKNFFKELKAFVPKLQKDNYNVFYFDSVLYGPASSRFGYVLLSAAMGNSVNLAIPYNVNIDAIKIVNSFEDFLRIVNNPPAGKKVSYFVFYNDQNGLHDTTSKVFALLRDGSNTLIKKEKISYVHDKESSSVNIQTNNISSLTPLSAKFDLIADALNPAFFTFPYIGSDAKNDTEIASIKDYYQKNNIQKDKIFKYLLSRENYYKTVKVDVESIHIAKQNPASHLVDDNPDTFWISDQSRWEVHIRPWVTLNLGQEKNIGRIIWRQIPGRIITDFDVFVSLDGQTWTKINNIHQSHLSTDNNLVINDFYAVDAHFIKVTINGLTGPGPGLAEIEIVESEFSNLDLGVALRIKENPFEYIENEAELTQTYSYLSKNAQLEIITKTNKDDPASNTVLLKLPIVLDGYLHSYEFQIPAGGTELKNIRFQTNFPISLTIDNFVLENVLRSVLDEQLRKKCADFVNFKIYANPFNCK